MGSFCNKISEPPSREKRPKMYGDQMGRRTYSVSLRLPELDYDGCSSFHDECNRSFSMSHLYISLIKGGLRILKDEETPIPKSYKELAHLRAIHELKRNEAREDAKMIENFKDEDILKEFKELKKKFEKLQLKVLKLED